MDGNTYDVDKVMKDFGKDSLDIKKVGNSIFYTDADATNPLAEKQDGKTLSSLPLGSSGQVIEGTPDQNKEEERASAEAIGKQAAINEYAKECITEVAGSLEASFLEADLDEKDSDHEMRKALADLIVNHDISDKEFTKKLNKLQSVESNSSIIIKIKEFFSAIIEFITPPYNKTNKANLNKITNETKEAIKAERNKRLQNSSNSVAIDNQQPRRVENITRQHSLSAGEDLNRAATPPNQMSQPLSSPAIMATSTSPANNGILTEQQERPHSWAELGKTPKPLGANKEVIPKIAQFASKPVLSNVPPVIGNPNPQGPSPVPPTSPPLQHFATAIESTRDKPAVVSSEVVSTPTATPLKAEPVVPANSPPIPPAPPPSPVMSVAGEVATKPTNNIDLFAEIRLKGAQLRNVQDRQPKPVSILAKDPIFTDELKQKLNQIAGKAKEKTANASGGAATRFLEEQRLFAQAAEEEAKRQARIDEENAAKPVAEEVKQPVTPVNTNVPPMNFQIQYDVKGRPIAPPPPPPASDHKPNNPTLQRSVTSNGQAAIPASNLLATIENQDSRDKTARKSNSELGLESSLPDSAGIADGQDNTENRSTKNSPPPKRMFPIADEKTLQEAMDKIRLGGVKRVITTPITQEMIDRRTAEMQARHISSSPRKR